MAKVQPLKVSFAIGRLVKRDGFACRDEGQRAKPLGAEGQRDACPAVFAAYGWKYDLSDEVILEKLLTLNLERARQ